MNVRDEFITKDDGEAELRGEHLRAGISLKDGLACKRSESQVKSELGIT